MNRIVRVLVALTSASCAHPHSRIARESNASRDSGSSPPVASSSPPPTPTNVAAASPSPSPADSPLVCHRDDLHRASLRTLDPSLLSIEGQRVTTLAWAPPDPAAHRGTALVLGDPTASDCRALVDCTEEQDVVHGPFSGFPASGASWTARIVCGERLALVLLDADGTPRAALDAGEDHPGEDGWTGAGAWLRPLAIFPDGTSLVVGTYMTADGTSTYVLRAMSGFDGVLREIYTAGMDHEMGAPHVFTMEPDGPPRATPAIRVTRRRGQLRWDEQIDDNRVVYGRATIERRVFDPHRRRFR